VARHHGGSTGGGALFAVESAAIAHSAGGSWRDRAESPEERRFASGQNARPAAPDAPDVTATAGRSSPAQPLRVLTLNLAHGRGDGFHQALTSREQIEANLEAIARVLRRERPDVAALQEADGPSLWSGRLNHVQRLAEAGGLEYSVRGEHVRGMQLSYGTALVAAHRLSDPLSVTFEPSPPTFSKGFVVASVAWPGRPELRIDLVSVHLDFLRESVQQQQVEELVRVLKERGQPCVIMGDFNCSWDEQNSPLRYISRALDLTPYQPSAPGLITFPQTDARLDWVLISPGLRFQRYQTLSETLSDHRAVVAEIAAD
jgi:endonuclease/exonuclease/phosphatase family metal-dependent hydrolase